MLKIPKGGNWLDIVGITLETAAGIALLAFAMQGHFRRQNTPVESALFIVAGLLLVFPSIINAVVRPLTGLSIETYLPGLSEVGIHLGVNVVLGCVVAATAIMLQQAKKPAAA